LPHGRGAKVMSPPSLSNILDDNAYVEEEYIIIGLFKVKCSVHGDALAKFDFLMETVASREATIEELTSHIENEKRRLNILKQELSGENKHYISS
jgi:hypothetical protein